MGSTTIAQRIEQSAISIDDLQGTYRPMLALVNELIGVVPYCDKWLEIWPPGFRTYNLIVPNFLDLPSALFGRGAPKDLVGLAMYSSSRAAGCAYCSAHTCSFAIRRGSSLAAVTGEARTEVEQAVVDLAEALSTDPTTVERDHVQAVRRHLSAENTDWIVASISMMGFLNKFMDAMGIELEQSAIDDVTPLIESTGWSAGQHAWREPIIDLSHGKPPVDSLGTYLRIMRHGPAASRLENRWLRGVPTDPDQMRSWLFGVARYDQSLLDTFANPKLRRAVAALCAENLLPERSELGVGLKVTAGRVFADHVGSNTLLEQADRHLNDRPMDGIDIDKIDVCQDWVSAISSSPANVDDTLAQRVEDGLTPAEIVELTVWVSVLQLLHRWDRYDSVRS